MYLIIKLLTEQPAVFLLPMTRLKGTLRLLMRRSVSGWAKGKESVHIVKCEGQTETSDYPPRVTVGPENPIRVERGDTAELLCKDDSKPRVTGVRWIRENAFVQTNFTHLVPKLRMPDSTSALQTMDWAW